MDVGPLPWLYGEFLLCERLLLGCERVSLDLIGRFKDLSILLAKPLCGLLSAVVMLAWL